MEQKVFVLIDESCYDYECSVDVRVFDTFEGAREMFDAYRRQAIADWVDNGDWIVFADDEKEFEAGQCGYYAINHVVLRIVERIVQTKQTND